MTFETIWSGSQERAGLCPGLSTYEGPSQLASGIVGSNGDAALAKQRQRERDRQRTSDRRNQRQLARMARCVARARGEIA
jgi:hypothetical protein